MMKSSTLSWPDRHPNPVVKVEDLAWLDEFDLERLRGMLKVPSS